MKRSQIDDPFRSSIVSTQVIALMSVPITTPACVWPFTALVVH